MSEGRPSTGTVALHLGIQLTQVVEMKSAFRVEPNCTRKFVLHIQTIKNLDMPVPCSVSPPHVLPRLKSPPPQPLASIHNRKNHTPCQPDLSTPSYGTPTVSITRDVDPRTHSHSAGVTGPRVRGLVGRWAASRLGSDWTAGY